MSEVARLRGEGRWAEALELVDDPLARADLLNEQALFAGDTDARAAAGRELDRAEARLLLERGRVLHAAFLAEREEDPRELELFERGLALARIYSCLARRRFPTSPTSLPTSETTITTRPFARSRRSHRCAR